MLIIKNFAYDKIKMTQYLNSEKKIIIHQSILKVDATVKLARPSIIIYLSINMTKFYLLIEA